MAFPVAEQVDELAAADIDLSGDAVGILLKTTMGEKYGLIIEVRWRAGSSTQDLKNHGFSFEIVTINKIRRRGSLPGPPRNLCNYIGFWRSISPEMVGKQQNCEIKC